MPHQTVGHKYLYPSHLLVACWVAKNICICTFSINADMQSRQNNKRFNRTSYLYYTHFQLNIYWHFIQKTDKIPKTHMFWGLKYSTCHLFENCGARLAAFKPYFFLSFIRGSLVKKPAFLRTGLYSESACRSALEIPCLIAPA